MSHRTTARLLPVALGASLTVIAPAADAGAAPRPVDVQRESIALDAIDGSGLTEQLDTRDFRVAGVTWEGHRTDVETSVRTRDADSGDWSDWTTLDPEGGPAAAARAESTRGGTEPLTTDTADGIQVRVESPGERPDDLTVDVIDPGTSPADATATPATVTSPQATSTEAESDTERPTVRSRAAWGADESMRRGDPEYGEVRGAVVHHTAGTNDYTKAEVPELIRGIYDYHVNSHGWDDIGYNVLVDKWGRLWEGRAGGLEEAVIGAHALGVNDETTGISALGNYDEAAAPDAMTAGIERFLAWKLDLHGVDPAGTATIDGEQRKTIIGHRDVNQTACPGQYLAGRLPEIRSGAEARQS
ncbi:peptidoglycan recognition protein family protein [Janibacter corallicola]|uniref:peptidoglycan recognition protein family protein n=1 Tax=Janibacter corallicola TaxID=415212 RepID=UPI000834798F|nr:peptidoglycan recognition protein [Janibacter corallicola]